MIAVICPYPVPEHTVRIRGFKGYAVIGNVVNANGVIITDTVIADVAFFNYDGRAGIEQESVLYHCAVTAWIFCPCGYHTVFIRIEIVVSVCRIIGGESACQRSIVFEKISVDRIKVINSKPFICYRLAILVLDAEFCIFSVYVYLR